jgi:hypothetical protein
VRVACVRGQTAIGLLHPYCSLRVATMMTAAHCSRDNCAASCFMHSIRRCDCSEREAGRDLAPEGHLEEGRCRGSEERIRLSA